MKNGKPVIIGLATYDGPGRDKSLPEVIEALTPQCDLLHIWYNQDLNNPDVGDIGKFEPFFNNISDAYFLTVDDDLLYPPDYVDRLITGIELYERKAVVSFHGREVFPSDEPWYASPGPRYFCLAEVIGNHPVTLVGTGTAGWYGKLIDPPLQRADFPVPNMADIWFSKACNDKGVPKYALEHEAKWIKHSPYIDIHAHEDTIWARYVHDHHFRTNVFNNVNWRLRSL